MNNWNPRRTVLSILFLLILSLQGHSQNRENTTVLAFIGIQSTSEIGSEADIIEKQLISAVTKAAKEINFTIIVPENRDKILKEIEFAQSDAADSRNIIEVGKLLSADGIITGEIISRNEKMYLSIELIKTVTGETIMAEFKDAESFDELLKDAGKIVNRLFDLERSHEFTKKITLDMLAGEWEGDKGIESITISLNGFGKVFFNSWNSMRVRVKIEGDSCVIEQAEPNAPKMYTTVFSYNIALQASDLARPMKWTFMLSEDLQTLTGVKDTSYFEIENDRIIFIDNKYTRPAVWERIR
jgi:hypothetical protein